MAGAETQYVNRIGLGVYTDDPGGAGLSHLRTVRTELRAILDLSRQLATVRMPRLPGGAAGGASSRQDIENQGRLFSDGQARQQSLFTRNELEKTRIHQAQSRVRRATTQSEYAQDVEAFERAERRKRHVGQHQTTAPTASDVDVDARANTVARRREMNERINRRADEITARRQQDSERTRRAAQSRDAGYRQQLVEHYAQATPAELRRRAGLLGKPERDELVQAQRDLLAQELRKRRATAQEGRRARAEAEAARAAAPPRPAANYPADDEELKRVRAERVAKGAARQAAAGRKPVTETEAKARIAQAEREIAEEAARRAAQTRVERRRATARAELAVPEGERVEERRAAADLRRERQRIERGLEAGRPMPQLVAEEAARENVRRRRADARNRVKREAPDEDVLYEETEREAERRRRRRIRTGLQGPDEYNTVRRAEETRIANQQLRQQARGELLPFDTKAAQRDVSRATDELRRFRDEAAKISLRRPGTQIAEDANRITARITTAQKSARALREELARPGNLHRTRQEIEADINRIVADAARAKRELQHLREDDQEAGPAAQEEKGGGARGGAGAALQRIVRNMAIRAAVFYSIYNLKKFAEDSVEAARIAAQTERQLAATSQQAGTTFAFNARIAEQIRTTADLSRQEAQATESNIARFAGRVNRRGESGQFATAITDLAAARGIENKNLAQTVDRLFRGEGVEEVLGRDSEALIKDYARQQVRTRYKAPAALTVGRERPEFKTERQQVEEYISTLTDAQKAEIIWAEALKQGNEAVGEAARRHSLLDGQLDGTNARWADAKVAVGDFVEGLHPLQNILRSISDLLGGLDTSKLRLVGTGAGGLITDEDVARNAQARANSPAAIANRNYDAYGGGVEGVLGLGLLARYGPGVTKSVQTGAKSIATGVSNYITKLTGGAAAAAEGEAAAAAGIGVAGITGIGVVFIAATSLITGAIRKGAEERLARVEAEVGAENARLLAQQKELKTGQAFYRLNLPGYLTDRYTKEQMEQLIADGRAGTAQFDIPFDPNTQQESRTPTGVSRRRGLGPGDFEVGRTSDEDLAAQNDRVAREKAADEKMKAIRDDFWTSVDKEEERKLKERVDTQNSALGKLREAQQGSFRLVEEIASAYETNNPFVKIFSDGATAAERMALQWNFMGKQTVDYFTQLETGRIKLALVDQRFQSLAQSQELVNKAEREMAERDLSPDLTREEQAVGRLAQSLIRAAQEIPRLQQDYREMVQGIRPDRYDLERTLQSQVSGIDAARGVGVGQDAQGRREVDRYVNEAILSAVKESGLTPAQVYRSSPWLRERYAQANLGQQSELRAQIQDDLNRIRLQQQERQRLQNDVAQTRESRQTQEEAIYSAAERQGRGTAFQGRFVGQLTKAEEAQLRHIGEASDRSLIKQTDTWSPRELAQAGLFEERNEAIRREAQRSAEQDTEALLAGSSLRRGPGRPRRYP
jgi:hypothetical protein